MCFLCESTNLNIAVTVKGHCCYLIKPRLYAPFSLSSVDEEVQWSMANIILKVIGNRRRGHAKNSFPLSSKLCSPPDRWCWIWKKNKLVSNFDNPSTNGWLSGGISRFKQIYKSHIIFGWWLECTPFPCLSHFTKRESVTAMCEGNKTGLFHYTLHRGIEVAGTSNTWHQVRA